MSNDDEVPLDLLADRLPGVTGYPARDGLPAFGSFDGLVVLGGRMSVEDVDVAPWLPDLGRLMIDCGAAGVPVLAICLGAQLLAVAGRGSVQVGAWAGPERGIVSVRLRPAAASDPILGRVQTALGTEFAAPSMHADAVAELPPDAQWLASSSQYPFQAFRMGSALALQFHPEAGAATMCAWAEGHDLDTTGLGEQLARHADDLRTLADAIASGFLREVRTAARRRR
ncbi:MAG: type 1 glutamine amidotransferase [Propionicimonas sp.]|nr:type 1 glutamine amidotransferase [Propionicimonas sp.]